MIPQIRQYRFDNHRVLCTWISFWLFTRRYDCDVVAFELWMKYQRKERMN